MAVFRRVLLDRKSTRLNSSHTIISYAVFCLEKKRDRKSTRLNSSHTIISYAVFCLKTQHIDNTIQHPSDARGREGGPRRPRPRGGGAGARPRRGLCSHRQTPLDPRPFSGRAPAPTPPPSCPGPCRRG